MTKVTILGQSHEDAKPKKKIEFVKYIDKHLDVADIRRTQTPEDWDNIVLLCKGYTHDGLDLMYAYDDDVPYKALVLGYFNDGVV